VFKRIIWTLALVAVVGALAAVKVLPKHESRAATSASSSGSKSRPPGANGTSAAQAPVRKSGGRSDSVGVSTIVVAPGRFVEAITSTGTLRAEESVELQAEISGKVTAINFTEGARVRRGDLLVKLNDAETRATLSGATYRQTLAKLREQRFAKLLEQGVARQEEYDTALNDVNIQKAQAELFEAQLAKTEIRAPFDGVVGLRYVSEGALINAATRVATLQRLDKLKIDFSVPEKYATRIRPGSPVTFTVAGGERSFKGTIYAFDPRIDSVTRTVVIRAVALNTEGKLLPGAFATIALTLQEVENAILVPSVAVIPEMNEKSVFVVHDGKAERRVVETGTRLENSVHIVSGLKPGDEVITSALQQMRDGQAVRVANFETAAHDAHVTENR
jgi:membrane fusion protein, multidrug efflux system